MSLKDYFHGKRVLVTGAGGFVGTHLVRRLVELGAVVRGTLHIKPPQRSERAVEYVTCDLTNPKDCAAVTQKMDFVFMGAALSSGAGVMAVTPLVHLTPNVVMNAHMLAAAYENAVKKFCFISSNTVYPLTDFPVKEEDANYDFFEKYFVVGWMKRFTEIMCQMYAEKIESPMEVVVIRPGNLYGPFDKYSWKESKVVAALIRRAVERHNPFAIWGDGLDIKDFLYVEDFVQGVLLSFERVQGFSPLNIASGQPVTVRDVLDKVLAAADYKDARIEYDLSKPTMIPIRKIDISRVRDTTGWEPQTSMTEGIQRTIEWYRATYASQTPEDF